MKKSRLNFAIRSLSDNNAYLQTPHSMGVSHPRQTVSVEIRGKCPYVVDETLSLKNKKMPIYWEWSEHSRWFSCQHVDTRLTRASAALARDGRCPDSPDNDDYWVHTLYSIEDRIKLESTGYSALPSPPRLIRRAVDTWYKRLSGHTHSAYDSNPVWHIWRATNAVYLLTFPRLLSGSEGKERPRDTKRLLNDVWLK